MLYGSRLDAVSFAFVPPWNFDVCSVVGIAERYPRQNSPQKFPPTPEHMGKNLQFTIFAACGFLEL